MNIKEVKIKVDNRNSKIILIFIIHSNNELYIYQLNIYFMSSNIYQNQFVYSTNALIPNGTANSQPFNVSNNTNLINGLSTIRLESPNQLQQNIHPTGSQILQNQQFLQSQVYVNQQQQQIKQQQQSRIQLGQPEIRGGNFLQSQFMNNGYDNNLLQSRPFQGSQEQQNQQRSNLQNSYSNIMTTENWTENDYAKLFEQWEDLIQKNQDFVTELEINRLQIPLANVILQEILNIKTNILKNSFLIKLSQYYEIIKPQADQMAIKSEELQTSLRILKQTRQPPINKYANLQYEQQQPISNIQHFNQKLSHLKLEMQNQINLTKSILLSINNQHNYIEPQENYQQKLENSFNSLNQYLQERMTQEINFLLFIHEREVFNLERQIESQIQESDTFSITILSEKLRMIEGLFEKFSEKKQELRDFQQRLVYITNRNINQFSEFFEDVISLYKQYKIYYEEIKQIQQIPNQQIFQNLQIKTKQQLYIAAKNVWLEIKQLYFNGKKIQEFNEEEKYQQFSQFNIPAQVQQIKSFFNQLQQDYIRKGFQVPLEESKKLKQLIYMVECEYQVTNPMRLEISTLEQQDFIGYKNYINQNLKPKFFIDFKEFYAKDFYEIIYFQQADLNILESIKKLLQFKFPIFDWNENIEDEKQRIEIVLQRHKEVQDKLQELQEQFSKDTKFVKQLINWNAELFKCVKILKQYLIIKEELKGQLITLLKWPQQFSIQKINEQPPINKYANLQYEQQQPISNIQHFNQKLSHLKLEMQNQINLTKSILLSINNQHNYIEPQENYQQKLENSFNSLNQYLQERMTQEINFLLFIHEREVFNLERQIESQIQESDTFSITILSEKLRMIEGLFEKFSEKKQELRDFQQRLVYITNRNINQFSEFFEDVISLYKQYKIYYEEIKQIQQIPNQQIFQNLQIKTKQQLYIAAKNVWLEIKQLYFNGKKIQEFNEEEKYQQFSQFNIPAQVQQIKSFFNQLQQDYIRKGFQVPLEESKKLKQLIYMVECEYQVTNPMRLEISTLEQQDFIGYKNYINQNLKPKFFIDFKEFYAKDFYEIIYFQQADLNILESIKKLLQFKFPIFDWNENIEDEKQRIEIVLQRHKEVQDKLQELQEQFSKDTKFVKQLINWNAELFKCVKILKQYLIIKEELKGQLITLLKWPQQFSIQKINEFSVHCEQIIRQANSYVLAIEQLQQMKLIENLEILFKQWNPKVKDYLIEQCHFINQTQFSPLIIEQMQIVYQFLYVCMECLNYNIDEVFCRTSTYQELENILNGSTKLQELKSFIDGNIHNSALRYKLYDIIEKFMQQKLIIDFQSLFELKLEQSKEGTNNFNPKELVKRTDLKFPINRTDIQSNFYCKQNMDRINQIVDQPELRLIFQQFRELLNNITTIIDQDNSVTDIQVNQITIIELACSFAQQLLIQNELTNIKPLIKFHQQLSQYPNTKQFQNQLIELGIVFPVEYNIYLDACRRRIQRLAQNVCIEFESLDFYEIAQAKLFFNNKEYLLKQIDFPYLYMDAKSLILEQQPLNFNCTLNFKINGKFIKQGETIQI
ncbi:unnamed protein product [Paramecium sonneborni]|uniref:CRIC domain-containing protein n=1 Tax=Paramecium sonneborni TaxID=65129 RepID=A0A8S1QQM4_9CILI|nr:unnamed protein product [Paramecium sonneborni]